MMMLTPALTTRSEVAHADLVAPVDELGGGVPEQVHQSVDDDELAPISCSGQRHRDDRDGDDQHVIPGNGVPLEVPGRRHLATEIGTVGEFGVEGENQGLQQVERDVDPEDDAQRKSHAQSLSDRSSPGAIPSRRMDAGISSGRGVFVPARDNLDGA
ncbi:hypothetical protein [Kribbella sp. NPDC051718]|uniref:hypothetical protein n=1 Tax=Kribbella sp. NPDC051718 TaxID=3155168 RepID=UPI00343C8380